MPEFIYKYKNAPRSYVEVVIATSPEKAQFTARLIRVEHDEEPLICQREQGAPGARQAPVTMPRTRITPEEQHFTTEPPALTGAIAIEMAMDELAYTLGVDPLEYRLKNYAENNPLTQQPWSAKFLRECYIRGREAAGWMTRHPKPASTRQGEWLVGYGMATAGYPVKRIATDPDVRSMALRMNTQYRRQPAGTRPNVPFPDAGTTALYRRQPATRGDGFGNTTGFGSKPDLSGDPGLSGKPGLSSSSITDCGAIFARVLVDPTTGLVRISRLTAILHIGRVPDIRTTRDNIISGMTLALGMINNPDSGQTSGQIPGQTPGQIPRQIDMPEFDIRFLDKPDPYLSRPGARELREIGMIGTIAAVANAVFHATGRRIRKLPVVPALLSHQDLDHWSHHAH